MSFSRLISFVLTVTICITMTLSGGYAAAGNGVLFEQTFDKITDLSEEATLTVNHNTSANSHANITGGAFVFGKTATGAATAQFNMASHIGTNKDYTVSFDLKLATTNSTLSVKMGSCIAFRPSNGKYTVEWHDSSAWVTTDKTEYDFAGGLNVKFVVKNKEKADLYIGGRLVKADIPRRQANNSYLFDKMILELANGLKGDITIDNLRAYIPGEDEWVVYKQDFSLISDISDDKVYTFKPNDNATAYANIENGVLSIGKSTKGTIALEADFASKLGILTDYLVSMDLTADISTGFTVNIRLGSTVAIRAAGDGKYTVEWNDGTSWITTDTTTYDLQKGATIRFLVKNREKVDMYIGNHLVQADIPRRYTQPFTLLGFDPGNSMTGSFTLDNIVVTADTTIETLPESEPDTDLPENAVTESDVPSIGAPSVTKESFDLYLAIGQSNMAGRAPLTKEDKISLPNTYLLNGNDEWESAQAQYVGTKWCGFNRYSTVRKTEAAQGLSPAFYFAKTVSEIIGGENKKIGIISNARGDTSIEAWQKGYTHDSKDFDLYEEAVRRAKIAMESGTLKGIIWHQGCANITSDSTSYINKFATLVENLRTDLGIDDLPVIIGEIPGFGVDSSRITNRMSFNKNCIARIPSYVDNCYVISSAGSRDIGDKTHFDNASQKRLGILYGEMALEKIYGAEPESLYTVPLINVSGNSSASVASDGVADIHSHDDSLSYWRASSGDTFTAEFAKPVRVKKIKSYFRNPYNYVARYKIYLISGDNRTLVADNSGITSYHYIAYDGAVTDDIEDIIADGVVVEITGGVDIDGNATSDIIGCHEFQVLTDDKVNCGYNQITVDTEGYNEETNILSGDSISLFALVKGDGVIAVAQYGAGDVLEKVDFAYASGDKAEIDFTVSSDTAKYLKVFLWKDMTSLIPLCEERAVRLP